MAFLTPMELLRIAGLLPELRAAVLPIMQATEDATGKKLTIPPNGGVRSYETQAALYAARATNPYPVAIPGTSKHECGAAVDLNIIGGSEADYATMAGIVEDTFELTSGWPDDEVHIELPDDLSDCQAAWADVQQQRSQITAVLAIGALAFVIVRNQSTRAR